MAKTTRIPAINTRIKTNVLKTRYIAVGDTLAVKILTASKFGRFDSWKIIFSISPGAAAQKKIIVF